MVHFFSYLCQVDARRVILGDITPIREETQHIIGWKSSVRVTMSVTIRIFAALWGIIRMKPCSKMTPQDLILTLASFYYQCFVAFLPISPPVIVTLHSAVSFLSLLVGKNSEDRFWRQSVSWFNISECFCESSPWGHTPDGCPGCHCGGQTWALCHL